MSITDVLSDISDFSNPFGASDRNQWNLSKGVFTTADGVDVVFFFEVRKGEDKTKMTAIDQMSHTTGRRLAVYEFPYVDGQKVNDLGRKGETFVFNIKFHGANYQEKQQAFEQLVVNDSRPGKLTHPTLSAIRGDIPVRLRDYEPIYRHDEFSSVTFRAVFIEDNTDELSAKVLPISTDSALRKTLQTLTQVQSTISTLITEVSALMDLPGAIVNAMKARLNSIIAQGSGLLGKLASTFSSDKHIQSAAQQSKGLTAGVASLNSGTTTTSSGDTSTLPPVFQVGFDPTTQEIINSNISEFVNANQVTPQEAVYLANQMRAAITEAIAQVVEQFGNESFDINLYYRELAVMIQEVVETCISASQPQVKLFVVPRNMSLRMIAKLNGLDPNRQNDIEALNPYLASVNFVAKGSKVLVPVV